MYADVGFELNHLFLLTFLSYFRSNVDVWSVRISFRFEVVGCDLLGSGGRLLWIFFLRPWRHAEESRRCCGVVKPSLPPA